ncbi:unnamed protein product [Schistosoma turkestanicum]|nr:unnamed protein product [Schistosoma turkestanicum]
MIAIPNTSENAVGNWGLITFTEDIILWYPESDLLISKLDLTLLISHEIVHQVDELLIVFEVYAALDIDATSKSHPVIFPEIDMNDFNVLDELITYSKGASVIQMMEMFMGHKKFMDGIKVWKSENNHLDIEFIMNSWTKQMNYPLVVVQRNQSNVFHFEQSRYLQFQDVDSSPEDEARDIVPYTYFLNATKYLKHEDRFIVWKTTSRALLYINSMLVLNENYGVFQAYLQTLLDSHIYSVSWSYVNDSQNPGKMLLDNVLARLASKAEHQLFVNKARELFRQWMSRPGVNPIPHSLRSAIYCMAIHFGGQREWKFLKSQLLLGNSSKTEEDIENIIEALTCSRDIWIMKWYLNWFRENRAFWRYLHYFAESPVGNRLLWDCLSKLNNLTINQDFAEYIVKAITENHCAVYDEAVDEEVLAREADYLGNVELKSKINDLLQKYREKNRNPSDDDHHHNNNNTELVNPLSYHGFLEKKKKDYYLNKPKRYRLRIMIGILHIDVRCTNCYMYIEFK